MELTFKLTTETKLNIFGKTLYRIEAIKDIPRANIKKGDKGGFIDTVIHAKSGNARVSGDAWVYGDAQLYGDAQVYGNAQVYGDAQVYGNARVYGNAQVYGDAQVSGDAQLYGDAHIDCDSAIMLIAFGSFYCITITRKYVFVGCKQWTRKEVKALTERKAIEAGCLKENFKPLKQAVLWGMRLVKENAE